MASSRACCCSQLANLGLLAETFCERAMRITGVQIPAVPREAVHPAHAPGARYPSTRSRIKPKARVSERLDPPLGGANYLGVFDASWELSSLGMEAAETGHLSPRNPFFQRPVESRVRSSPSLRPRPSSSLRRVRARGRGRPSAAPKAFQSCTTRAVAMSPTARSSLIRSSPGTESRFKSVRA